MFDSAAQPTMTQSRALIRAAIQYFGPELELAADVPMWETPPSVMGQAFREIALALEWR
jgi:hypothetical protein